MCSLPLVFRSALPFKIRQKILQSYQSLLWNFAASQRLKNPTNRCLQIGDLVQKPSARGFSILTKDNVHILTGTVSNE